MLTENQQNISDLPYLTADYFRSGISSKYVPSAVFNESIKCEKEDIILIWDGSNAGDCFIGLKGVLASTMIKIQPNEKVLDRYYAYFYLKTQFYKLNSKTTGSTIPHVSKNVFENLDIPLPPLVEQRAIAHILRTVQRAKEATEKVIAAARELKQSLMRHLFTYGPVPFDQTDQVELKETEIGLIPNYWNLFSLGHLTERPQYGFTASAMNTQVGPHFLRITDIQNGIVYWPVVPYCQCSKSEFEKYKLVSDDVLVARIGATTGKSYLIVDPPDSVFASYLIRIRTKGKLLPQFLQQFTNTPLYWRQINEIKGGRLKQGLNIPNLQGLKIPLPSLSVQREVAQKLMAIDKVTDVYRYRLKTLDALFKTLLHNLMTGKVRVSDVKDETIAEAL